MNVCVLALMTGITLGYDKEQLATLGVGALLHDLGKLKVPDSILTKPGSLTPEEFTVMKKHPVFGYELIKNARGLDEITAIIALQHHESFDGTGYPHGVRGDKFHEYAQITAIADKFDALTADRVYRKGYPPYEAYEMCAASGDFLFKGSIVKAFLHSIAAYPSGTLVELSNGQFAVVLDTPKGYSLFPRVRVLYDQRRLPLPPREVSLLEEKQLAVVRVLPEDEIQRLLQQ